MKVLIDECVPKAFKRAFSDQGHECMTVQEAGWAGIVNGKLLGIAEAEHDVLLTVDANLPHQQSLAGRRIAIVIIRARSNRLADLAPHLPACSKRYKQFKLVKLYTWD
jgi:predicted nuclease of predicted toxin-antitoxin system